MPKYKINDDGVLTILDDKPSTGSSNFRHITKRITAIAMVLAIILSAYSLLVEGPFAKGMQQNSWEQAMSAEGPHTGAGIALSNITLLDPTDGFTALAESSTTLFNNLISNLANFGQAIAISLDGLAGEGTGR